MRIMTDPTELHDHFYILPFRCDKCGNIFMFEHGLRRRNEYYHLLDFVFDIKKYEKYCDICSREVAKDETDE